MKTVRVVATGENAAILEEHLGKMGKRLWDNYAIIGEVRKNNKIKFVVGAGIRDGVRYINIREFYIRKRDEVWSPGRDGITIPLLIPVEGATTILTPYKELLKVLEETVEALEVMALADDEGAVYLEPKENKDNA